MTTLAQLTDDVLADVSAYVRNQESLTTLTASISTSDTELFVDDARALSRGMVEVDDELVYIRSVSATSNIVSVLPGTRGFRNTTAATHAAGAIVRNNPVFPRGKVQRAINETIQSVNLYQISKFDFTFDGVTLAYAMPAGTVDVTGVVAETWDASGRWEPVMRWRLDSNFWPAGATEAQTGIELLETPGVGRIVRVQTLSYGSPLATPATAFSASGLPASSVDVIRLGAVWRLLSTIDPGRVSTLATSSDSLDAPVPVGKSSDVSRYVYQMFQVRLAEERARQLDNLQIVKHYQS